MSRPAGRRMCLHFFSVGFALYLGLPVSGILLGVAVLFAIHFTYIALFVWKGFEVKIGGTEGRVILIILCLKCYFS